MTVRVTLTTHDEVYMYTGKEDKPYIQVGKLDSNNCMVVDFRSAEAVEAANKINAYSLTEDVD